jgi:hypothetical protein
MVESLVKLTHFNFKKRLWEMIMWVGNVFRLAAASVVIFFSQNARAGWLYMNPYDSTLVEITPSTYSIGDEVFKSTICDKKSDFFVFRVIDFLSQSQRIFLRKSHGREMEFNTA